MRIDSKIANQSKKVLFVHYGDNWLRGSEICLINLVNDLPKEHFTPVIWTNNSTLFKEVESSYQSFYSPFSFVWNELTPSRGFSSWFQQVKYAINLIKQNNISLIHVNSAAPCQWMLFASYITGTPMITHLHSPYGIKDRLSFGVMMAPLIVTVSFAISKELRGDGVDEKNFRVIPNGINQYHDFKGEPIKVKQRLGLTEDDKLLVTVGSLIHRKGVDTLIRVVDQLKNETVPYHLLVIGDGIERSNLERLSKQLGVSDRVHFVGEQHSVYSWLKGGVDIFISGARSEAFGLVIAEAASASVPVIAPNIDGIPEVLIHNHSALLYKNSSPKHLAQLVKRVDASSTLKSKLVIAAKNRVKNNFSIRANSQQFSNLYREVLRKPNLAIPATKSLFNPFLTVLLSEVIKSVKRRVSNQTLREI